MVVNEMMALGLKLKEANIDAGKPDDNFDINDYINDVPLLVDDLTDDEDELESRKNMGSDFNDTPVKFHFGSSMSGHLDFNPSTQSSNSASDTSKDQSDTSNNAKKKKITTNLAPKVFKQERNQLMMVIVKYISIKITDLFPPTSTESKLSLEKFLIIMINRLKLSLNNFLKAAIYLFRYMDIIYLLRYLNQSNNYANFNEMVFPLKKLIVACFKLTLLRERIYKNWHKLTGLTDNEINVIIKFILKRLNNKVAIKNNEILKLKTETFRYLKMVSTEVSN